MSNVTEFAPALESCIATITQPLSTGEMYSGPLHIGCFRYEPEDAKESREVFIEQEGARINVAAKYIPALIRQLRRAQKILSE